MSVSLAFENTASSPQLIGLSSNPENHFVSHINANDLLKFVNAGSASHKLARELNYTLFADDKPQFDPFYISC